MAVQDDDGPIPSSVLGVPGRVGFAWAEFLALGVPGAILAVGIPACTFGPSATIDFLRSLPLTAAPLLYGVAFGLGFAADQLMTPRDWVLGGPPPFMRGLVRLIPERLFESRERKQNWFDQMLEPNSDKLLEAALFYGESLELEIRRAAAHGRAALNFMLAFILLTLVLTVRVALFLDVPDLPPALAEQPDSPDGSSLGKALAVGGLFTLFIILIGTNGLRHLTKAQTLSRARLALRTARLAGQVPK